MAASGVGRITVKNSALFLCDMQEKFRKTISFYPQIIAVSSRMLKTAQILDMPVVVTEQYPKGLGLTMSELDISKHPVSQDEVFHACVAGLGPTVSELDVSKCPVFPKMKFSMMIPEVEEHIKQFPDLKSIIICGIEGHVCVQSSVLDFKERGFDVHVVADAVSSRSMVDRMFALQRMREAGACLTTSESVILGLCQGSDHPNFREIQKIIWDTAPDSGLLGHTVNGETPV